MKWALYALGTFVALIVLVFLIGSSLAEQHAATRVARFHQSPETIWGVITDYSRFPQWRKNVTRVEPLPAVNGKPSWREFDKYNHSVPYEIVEWTPPRRLSVRIADPNLPFGGTWTYELTPQADGNTALRITENGEIHNVFFRFVARFFIGYTATMEDYLKALGLKFNEQTAIED
jgi:uncharacterized protein YndB with AHSA1/START domain